MGGYRGRYICRWMLVSEFIDGKDVQRSNIPSPVMRNNVASCEVEMVDAGHQGSHVQLVRD